MTIGPLEWPTRDLLAHRASTSPDELAVVDADSGEEWTYAEFDRCVDGVARRLEALVREESDIAGHEGEIAAGGADRRLGIVMDTRPAFAATYFAAMRRGIVVVALNVRETVAELESKAERTGLDAIVCEAATEERALEISVAADCPIASVDEPSRDGVSSVRPFTDSGPRSNPAADLESDSLADLEPISLESDRTHLLVWTSGTTGEPKVVRLTLGNVVASATASAFRLGVSPDDRWLCCLPMYHMGGLAPVVRSVLYGTTVVIQREFSAGDTGRVIEEYGVTGVSLVPTMCKRLLEAGWRPPEALRFVLLGGAPASSDLLERCLEAGVPVYPTYGMTETASQVATATPAETREYEGTVGRPLVVTDVSIVDDGGEPVAPGEPGELVVSGPTVTPGYLDADHTADAVSELGFHTGDVGYRDDGGRLWILNRRSDRIVTGGENVDPGEVIATLRSHPAIDDAAVVGLEDERWGERVSALVVPVVDGDDSSENADDSAEDGDDSTEDGGDFETRQRELEPSGVLEHCRDRLAGFKHPKTIAVVDSLPRTASGTVDREAVRERLREDGADVSGPT
ncbi:class I adenylate-forming enzyme family protein [Natrarchaeobius chitinivorans]|uniref:2-succinylbenzoate--CoA ligase n=1 Tax=Natrarchaeobius chitinivorans TaxID=1679083 RepID=A0A3N6MJG4_NATCH|nr:class I adenylate-forming enzyme family protein [Natrarchaeobius chitinivorans]RQG95951.1 2-succinylbenzoate--CoA ligase [Natrarchaeobius chitinivorans]